LDQLNNTAALTALDAAQQRALAERGFVAVPGSYTTFDELHRDVTADGLPLLLTADVALYTLDVVVDVAWQRAERQLADHLQALTIALVAASQEQWEAAEDEAIAEAAWHNLAYFSVGARLLEPGFNVSGVVAEVVGEELTLISQGGAFVSPLRGEILDYGRLQPPARYVADPALARYFQARHWLAQPFTLSAGDPDGARRQARQLALMGQALDDSDNSPRWQRIADTLAYFENSGSGHSLEAVSASLQAVGMGSELEDSRVDDLAATLLALPAPPSLAPPPAQAVFTFLPPAAQPSQTLLPAFVYNQVGAYEGEPPLPLTAVQTNIGAVRALPRVLDAAALLGSEAALNWLQTGGDTLYQGYDSQLARLRPALQGLAPVRYGAAWLQALAPLLPASASSVETQRFLNSWIAGWMLHHHDAALEPLPVDWESAGAAPVPAFVEPQPAIYASLAALARQVEVGLRQRDLLDPEAGQKLLQLERLYLALEVVAATDPAGEPLDSDSRLLLQQLAPRLEALLIFEPPSGGVPLADGALARQLTTYTDRGSGARMVVGTGPAWLLYALMERDGEWWLAAGGIFSTYELRLPAGESVVPDPDELLLSPWLHSLLASSPSP
jgi:hypothetical protein